MICAVYFLWIIWTSSKTANSSVSKVHVLVSSPYNATRGLLTRNFIKVKVKILLGSKWAFWSKLFLKCLPFSWICNCKYCTIKTTMVFLTILPTRVLMEALARLDSLISYVFGYYLLLFWVCIVRWFSIPCCMFCYWKRPFFVLKLIKRLQSFVICNVLVIQVPDFTMKMWKIFYSILWTAGGRISLRKKYNLDSCISLLT